jgi:uncharacterized protein
MNHYPGKTIMLKANRIAVAVAMLSLSPAAFSVPTYFENYTPALTGIATIPTASPLEATPLLLSFAGTQQSLANRAALPAGTNSGNWDMITANETGPDAGRYLFAPFETGTAGVMRYDRVTMTTTSIVANGAVPSNGTGGFVAGDASRWTPWGTYLTAEESWGATPANAAAVATAKGRLFEVRNPTTATAGNGDFVQRAIIPRVSHEGLAFDAQKRMYFVDELNGGSIYRYTSVNPNASDGDAYFAAGKTQVLRVGRGDMFGATGAAVWVDITDANGAPLPGVITLPGTTQIDGRATANLAAYKGTDFNRPEDLEIKTLANGKQRIFVATTDAQQVFSLDIDATDNSTVQEFVGRNTINLATGLAVGGAFTSPDNIAIDANGNVYIVEDQPGGSADIWRAHDADGNGVAETVGRWLSLGTNGAEPTGLYFDPFNPNVAFLNVQHPASGDDRLLQITAVPEPASLALLAGGLGLLGFARRKSTSMV